jgi:hypothetical protein
VAVQLKGVQILPKSLRQLFASRRTGEVGDPLTLVVVWKVVTVQPSVSTPSTGSSTRQGSVVLHATDSPTLGILYRRARLLDDHLFFV